MTNEEHLLELLPLKDKELAQAEQANAELTRQMEFGVDWMLHWFDDTSTQTLPRPRLEFRLIENAEFYAECEVALVLEESGGKVRYVPLEHGKLSGGGVQTPGFPTTGTVPPGLVANLSFLLRSGCRYSQALQLPLYVVLDEDHRYQATSVEPLVLEALS